MYKADQKRLLRMHLNNLYKADKVLTEYAGTNSPVQSRRSEVITYAHEQLCTELTPPEVLITYAHEQS